MRFPIRFFSKKNTSRDVARSNSPIKSRITSFERLESRDLLALSTTSADYKALVAAKSFGDSEENAIWVTSLSDTVSTSDGKISLREALDYAGQSLKAGNVSTTIRFAVNGTITLSATRQSLKAGKSVVVDGSDVGGIKIKAQNTLALYVYGGTTASPVNVTLNDVTITGGSAAPTSTSPAKGAAIQVASNCNLTLNECSIVGNTSQSALGVGVYMTNGTLKLNDVVFDGNVSTGAASKGGAVYLEAGSIDATNVVFTNNTAGEGGAIYVKSGDVSFANSLFDGNVASDGSGGALSSSSQITIANTAFRNNSSAVSGGAIYANGDVESVFTDVSFANNSSVNGGAIAQDGQSITVTGASFANNVASENGGAAYIVQNALLIANDASFVGNRATKDGGALYDAGSFYLNSGKIEENESKNNGGAISASGYFEIRDAEISGNTAAGYGGSINLSGTQRSWLLRSSIVESTANEGGGVYNTGILTVVDSCIADNVSATSGGGVSNAGSMMISASEVANNTASGLNAVGGGVLNYVNATLDVDNTSFVGNVSETGSGGAIANSGTATLDDVVVAENAAELFGGGVFNSGTLTSQYSTFNNNQASDGGAIANVYGSSAKFVGSTLWGNVASNNGGALYSYGSTVFQSSTIAYNVGATANVAAYYTPEEATESPSFDSTTTVESNLAASAVPTVKIADSLVVADAQTGETIDSGLLFGGTPVNGSIQTRTVSITNTGTADLRLSGFSTSGNAETNVLSCTLYNQSGEILDTSVQFTIGAGETFTLKIDVAPKVIGSKYFELKWNTTELNASGKAISGTKKTFSIQGSVEISKLASSTTSVASIGSSGYNVSVNEDGSFNISLSKKPSSNVILYLGTSSDAAQLSTDVLLFTPSNYNSAQTVTVSLNQDKLADAGYPSSIAVYPQLLSTDSNFSGATFEEITLKVANYIVFQDDCYVDLDSYATPGVSRWDLDGDGVVEAISYGTGYWINSSSVSGDTINYKRTKSGTTTTTEFDVVYQTSAPTAVAELTTIPSLAGYVRLTLESETSVAQWRVDWGDGSPYSVVDELSTDAIFAHVYAENGSYNISVELIDANGNGSGVWTSVKQQEIAGLASTSSTLDDESELFVEDAQISSDVVDVISGAILAEQEREKLFK